MEQYRLLQKIITLNHQMVYLYREGYFFSTLKTQSSNRKILIDDYLVGELTRWKNRQVENEKSLSDSYVYIYRNSENKIIQQTKGLGEVDVERIFLICTYFGVKETS